MKSEFVTIQRHLQVEMQGHPEAAHFTGLMWDLVLALKQIHRAVNRAGLADVTGDAGRESHQGDALKKLDLLSHDAIVGAVERGGHLCAMASEEDEHPILIPTDFARGDYVLLFDPLDGSSNIDANVPIGTIFSLYRRVSEPEGSDGTIDDLLQPGDQQIAAGYALYGSSTMLVYTTGKTVNGFTLDPSLGEFLLSHPNMHIPARGRIYSCNEGNASTWSDEDRSYVERVKTEDGRSGRYIGSLVADFHRNLLYGGIFLYPADASRKPARGKLRLIYEANPLARICEVAGGAATDGDQRILEIEPTDLHQRVPLIIGSADDVATYCAHIRDTPHYDPETTELRSIED